MFASKIKESSHFGAGNSAKIIQVHKVSAVSDKLSGLVRHHPSGSTSQRAAMLFPAFILCVVVGLGIVDDATAQTTASVAEVKPSSLNEVYSDWKVSCQKSNANAEDSPSHCQMIQELRDKKSGQLIMAFALPGKTGKNGVNALIIAPFGLNLAEGVVVSVGESEAAAKTANQSPPVKVKAPFHTCLPSGCLARFSLNKKMKNALKRGIEAQIKMVSADQNKPVHMNISLKGFTAAERRLRTLAAKFD